MDQDLASSHREKNNRESMARRIGSILNPKKKGGRSGSSNASMSVVDDNATQYSREGDKSVALTVNSQVTVKASNKILKPSPVKHILGKSAGGKGGWMSFRRLVGAASTNSQPRGHSKSEDFIAAGKTNSARTILSGDPLRKRILSADGAYSAASSNVSARARSQMDLAIRGRLDGVDCMSLGPASKTTLPRGTRKIEKKISGLGRPRNNSSILVFDPLKTTFSGETVSRTPADIVNCMVWSSGGKELPELIFEGYFPGGDDRWTVRLGKSTTTASADTQSEQSSPVKPAASADDGDDSTAELTEDGSTNMPAHMLWDHIWGKDAPPPVPAHMQSGSDEEEDIMQLVAGCSVPVDLDEDTFIIDSPEHFRSVHNVAMVPIQNRRFDAAMSIFDKMLRGLEDQANPNFEHLQACTHHNVGIILMFQSNFSRALERFQSAVRIRTRCLPQNHPDVAVSLVRQGESYFALQNYAKALESFKLALDMSPTEDATRAKILNNMGVVYYQQEKFSEALTAFTAALEIQRQWLDDSIRRESMIYDASITLGNMGKVFLELEDFEVAYSVFEEACLVSFKKYVLG